MKSAFEYLRYEEYVGSEKWNAHFAGEAAIDSERTSWTGGVWSVSFGSSKIIWYYCRNIVYLCSVLQGRPRRQMTYGEDIIPVNAEMLNNRR